MRIPARRTVFAAAAVLAVLCVVVATQAGAARLTLLHANDLYEIAPKRGKGGVAPLMTLLEAERARAGGATLTTFGGDLISPSVMSGWTQGAQMIDLANAIGIDAAVPGNHELDFGLDVLARRVADSRFPWLAANVQGPDGEPPAGLRRSVLRTVGDIKVGLFGLLTPETATLAKGGGAVRFAPPMRAAAETVARLRQAGAEVVIALTHLHLADDRALARFVPGIDLILGGHDHYPLAVMEAGVLILKSGSDAETLGVVTFDIERVAGRDRPAVVTKSWRHVPTAGVSPHAAIAQRVRDYQKKLDDALGELVGHTTTRLDSRRLTVRRAESTMGDLIADAMREAVGADIALINGGGIRGNRIYQPGATLTRRDIYAELPFGDVTELLELSGAELRAVLENAVSRAENTAGRFLQVSGLAFAWDPGAPAGRRVGRIAVAGKPLAPERVYNVAVAGYIAAGGDGYAMLKGAPRVIDADAATRIVTQVSDYIRARGAVAPRIEGRITETRR